MRVTKRDGTLAPVRFDEITTRLGQLCLLDPPLESADVSRVAARICSQIYDGIPTKELDVLASSVAYALGSEHPEYEALAARIVVSNMHKNTSDDVEHVFCHALRTVLDPALVDVVRANAAELQSWMRYDRDYDFDYFGLKTWESMYLSKIDGEIVERPQHVFLRVALWLWKHDLPKARETYEAMSLKRFTHASPTLFNAGTTFAQGSSCFLGGVFEDSLDAIFKTYHKVANVSKYGGGLGVHIHAVRSKGAKIRGTNGVSDGLVPMLKVGNEVIKYVNQCFAGDVAVYTALGPKEIEDVRVGDRVLTKDGTFKPVAAVFSRYVEREPILVVRTRSAYEQVRVTRVHDIYALKQGQEPGFYPADRLNPGDLVVYPVPTNVEAASYALSLDDCYRRGRAFGKGFGDPLEAVYLGLQRDKTRAFLRGALEVADVTIRPEAVIVQGPEHLLYALRYLCLRLGVLAASHGTDGIALPKHPKLAGIAPFQPLDAFDFFEVNGGVWDAIEAIDTEPYTGWVYDLSVEDNHNYVVDCGLVHNSGRRKGSMAVYLEPHHPDILAFLDLRRNQGDESVRARDLFYALWIPDLFMERVDAGSSWSLFDPSTAPGLEDVWGSDYRELYATYEREGRAVKTIPARDLWFAMMRSQIETGVPYMLYKDSVNAKSNQQNLGTIKNSNLCTEIVEYTSSDEWAVCTLGSLSLPAFLMDGDTLYDFDGLHAAAKVLAKNLDRVIDVTFYPIPEARTSNLRHRPVGIGIQGLQDVFFRLRMPFESPQAASLNRDIAETIYHAAMEASAELAEEHGAYETFAGSPASRGQLQFDLWGVTPLKYDDWDALKARIQKTGLRNALSIAPMPTASTAQLLGNVEAFEPLTSNIFTRKTMAGDFLVVNKHLQRDLLRQGLWTPELKDRIIANEGSVQTLDLPSDIKALYKTAWELSMKAVIDLAAARGPYVCQSQSLNLFVAEPSYKRLTSMHFYAWKSGLKTGMYYLRTRPATGAMKITVGVNPPPPPPPPPDCVACSG